MIPEVTAAGKALKFALEIVQGELDRVKLSKDDKRLLEVARCFLEVSLESTRIAFRNTRNYETLADRAAWETGKEMAERGKGQK